MQEVARSGNDAGAFAEAFVQAVEKALRAKHEIPRVKIVARRLARREAKKKDPSPRHDPIARMIASGFIHVMDATGLIDRPGTMRPARIAPPKKRGLARRSSATGEPLRMGGRVLRRGSRPLRRITKKKLDGCVDAFVAVVGTDDGKRYRRTVIEGPWVTNFVTGKLYPVSSDRVWRTVGAKLPRELVEMMFRGEEKASLDLIERARLVQLDFDGREEPTSEWWIRHGAPDPATYAGRKLKKRWLAEQLGMLVHEAQMVFPDEDVIVETSARGFHLTIVLERFVPVAVAASLAEAWRMKTLERSGMPLASKLIEAFPKLYGNGATGRTGTLPCGRGSRVVGSDLATPRYRTRLEDVERFLGAGLASVEGLRARLMELGGWSGVREGEEPSPPPACEATLHGEDFVLEAIRIVREGLGRGESWNEIRRVVAACLYCGKSDGATTSWVSRWIRNGRHRANHCGTAAGLRALESIVRAEIAHFRRGLTKARPDGYAATWRGGLRSRRLRAMLDAPAEVRERPYLGGARDLDAAAE
jgi:hypothetical protein